MNRVFLILCLVLLGVIANATVPRCASAQPVLSATDDKKQAARKYTEAGLSAARLGDYDTAIAFYQKAYSLVSHPVLIFDIAEAYFLSGRADQALTLYTRYLSDAPTGTLAQDARDRIAEIDVSKVEEARKVEDRKAAERKAEDERKSVEARRAETPRLTEQSMPLAPAAQGAVPAPRKHAAHRRWAAWTPWVVVGGGIGIAAMGAALDVLAARNFSAYDREFVKLSCATTGCTLPQVQAEAPHLSSWLRRARLEQQIAVGGFIAGGAVIASGVVLVYLNQSQRGDHANPNQGTLGVTVLPTVSRDLVGVAVTMNR